MFVKVAIVIFLSLVIEIESCVGGGGARPPNYTTLRKYKRVLIPAPYIEVDSS